MKKLRLKRIAIGRTVAGHPRCGQNIHQNYTAGSAVISKAQEKQIIKRLRQTNRITDEWENNNNSVREYVVKAWYPEPIKPLYDLLTPSKGEFLLGIWELYQLD